MSKDNLKAGESNARTSLEDGLKEKYLTFLEARDTDGVDADAGARFYTEAVQFAIEKGITPERDAVIFKTAYDEYNAPDISHYF